MLLYDTLISGFALLSLICIAGIVYPFKPFKRRSIAVLGFIVSFLAFAVSISSVTITPEYIEMQKQLTDDGIQTANIALRSQDYGKAEAALVGVTDSVTRAQLSEITQISNAIAKGRDLPIIQGIITNDEFDVQTKLKEVKSLWDGLQDNDDVQKALSSELEPIVLDLVKPIPSTELELNLLGYELLVDIDAYTNARDPNYAIKASSYADKITAKKKKDRVCLIPNYDLSLQVPRHLNDPRSFKPVRVYWGAFNNNDTRTVYMDYRAKNGFGGVISNTATGVVNLSTCELTLLSLE